MADTDDASSDGSVGSTSGEKDPQILSASYLQEATSKVSAHDLLYLLPSWVVLLTAPLPFSFLIM